MDDVTTPPLTRPELRHVLGPVAQPGPLEAEVHDEVQCEGYVRRRVSYDVPVGSGLRVRLRPRRPDRTGTAGVLPPPARRRVRPRQERGVRAARRPRPGVRGRARPARVRHDRAGRHRLRGPQLGGRREPRLVRAVLAAGARVAPCSRTACRRSRWPSTTPAAWPRSTRPASASSGTPTADASRCGRRPGTSASGRACRTAAASRTGTPSPGTPGSRPSSSCPASPPGTTSRTCSRWRPQCEVLLIAAEDDVWSRGARDIESACGSGGRRHVRVHVVPGDHEFRPPERQLAYEFLTSALGCPPRRT